MIVTCKHAKEWHFGIAEWPQDKSEIYMLVEKDCFTPTEPLLLDGYFRLLNNQIGKFCIVNEDGSLDEYSLCGGQSIYAWRYKHQTVNSWNETVYRLPYIINGKVG